MANEITLNVLLKLINGRNTVTQSPGTRQFDQTGTDFHRTKQVLTGSYASATKGSVGTAGFVAIENVEADGGENAVVSLDGGTTDHLSIEPGASALLPLASGFTFTNLQLKAASSASSAVVTVIEA